MNLNRKTGPYHLNEIISFRTERLALPADEKVNLQDVDLRLPQLSHQVGFEVVRSGVEFQRRV